MFPQWHMDMSWMGLTSIVWALLTVVAIVALMWLVATLTGGVVAVDARCETGSTAAPRRGG